MLLTQILQKIKSTFYTKSETDTLLGGKSNTNHNHNSTYLGIKAKAESAKSADSVAWTNVSGKPSTFDPSSHTHDDRYYTEPEVNNLLGGKANTSGTYGGLAVGSATKATQDSDGNKINTTYSKVGHTHSYNNLTDKPTIPTVPTNVSAFKNDSGYLKDSDITSYKFRCTGGWWNYIGYTGKNAYDNISINGTGDTIGGAEEWGSQPYDGWGQLISFSSDNTALNNTLHLWWGYNYRNKLLFRTYHSDGWSSWNELLTGSMGTLEVGSTVLATTNIALGYGQTTAGSNLKFAGLDLNGGVLDFNNSIGATGTWVKVSGNSGNNNGFGLYRRIA